jgi:hypothetical protein
LGSGGKEEEAVIKGNYKPSRYAYRQVYGHKCGGEGKGDCIQFENYIGEYSLR